MNRGSTSEYRPIGRFKMSGRVRNELTEKYELLSNVFKKLGKEKCMKNFLMQIGVAINSFQEKGVLCVVRGADDWMTLFYRDRDNLIDMKKAKDYAKGRFHVWGEQMQTYKNYSFGITWKD